MKNKKTAFIVIILLILCSSTAISTIDYSKNNERKTPYVSPFVPENITLQDDAFHKPTKLFNIETWYFDAKLDNNISMVFVICLFQIYNTGMVIHGFYLYDDSILTYAKRDITSLQNCFISYEFPSIRIGNTIDIKGWMENETNQWKYNINFYSSEVSVQLLFIKTVDGWKGSHQLGWWLAIPGLYVNGTLVNMNSTTHVSGKGYHDHNIYPIYVPFLAEGYHFGSISGKMISITWAKIETINDQQIIFAILSSNESNFAIIDPNTISFQVLETMDDNGVRIPKTFRLTITSNEADVNLTFRTISTHLIKVIGLRYWRYHCSVSGFISSKSAYEFIEDIEISELLKFFI